MFRWVYVETILTPSILGGHNAEYILTPNILGGYRLNIY